MLTLRLCMNTEDMLNAIDARISQLQQARQLIAGSATTEAAAPRRGRPRGAKRTVSAEGKARIAAGQKLRWAKQNNIANPVKFATKDSASATAKEAAAEPSGAMKAATPKA